MTDLSNLPLSLQVELDAFLIEINVGRGEIPLTDEEISDMSYYEALGRYIADETKNLPKPQI